LLALGAQPNADRKRSAAFMPLERKMFQGGPNKIMTRWKVVQSSGIHP
jgi:hypothetical protein